MPSYPAPPDQDEETPTLHLSGGALSNKSWRQARRDPRVRSVLTQHILELAGQKGGGARIVCLLARRGTPAIQLLETLLDPDQVKKMAGDHSTESETHPLFHAVEAGSLSWVQWLVKQGARLDWMDYLGNNLAGRLFQVHHLLDDLDALPIGKRQAAAVDRMSLNWLRGQARVAAWLNRREHADLWNTRNWKGDSMADVFKQRKDKIHEKLWHRSPAIKAELLKMNAGAVVAAPKKIKM